MRVATTGHIALTGFAAAALHVRDGARIAVRACYHDLIY